MEWQPDSAPDGTADGTAARPLGLANVGFSGKVQSIEVHEPKAGKGACLTAEEIECRLIELGFVEGADVRVLHQGPFARDPIAVRVNGTTVALRRREAMSILAR